MTTSTSLPASDFNPTPIIGISSGVIDPIRSKGGLDGIGTYTAALFDHVPDSGVLTKRVNYPPPRPFTRAVTTSDEAHFGLPLPVAIAIGSLTHTDTLGVTAVGRAIARYHAPDYLV